MKAFEAVDFKNELENQGTSILITLSTLLADQKSNSDEENKFQKPNVTKSKAQLNSNRLTSWWKYEAGRAEKLWLGKLEHVENNNLLRHFRSIRSPIQGPKSTVSTPILQTKSKTLKWDLEGRNYVSNFGVTRVWELGLVHKTNTSLFQDRQNSIQRTELLVFSPNTPVKFETLRLRCCWKEKPVAILKHEFYYKKNSSSGAF